MKNTNIRTISLLSVLALGTAVSASAQNSAAAPLEPAAIDPGPGLVGTNYSELSFGYQKESSAPSILRDYEFLSNEAFYREGIWGADANFKFDYLRGDANGFVDHRDEAQFGLTGFMTQSWGKPFLTGDAGMAWQQAGGVSRKSLAYSLTVGVEFQVLRNLLLSPFMGYEAEPHLYNHETPAANFPDHLLDYGVKATYRICRQWSASLTPSLDQYSGRDWGLRGGVSYRF
jgi:hypothetical protein